MFTQFRVTGNTLFMQTWSKKSKLSIEAEIWYRTNSNMQNSMVVFPFSVLNQKHPFLGKFGKKNQNF